MKISIEEAVNFLKTENNFLIVTHKRPDGDTIGSAAGLCLILRELGKTAFLFNNPEITQRYERFAAPLLAPDNYTGVVITVDMASEKMLPLGGEKLEGEFALCIDHHASNTYYSKLTLLDDELASCGELVYALSNAIGCELSASIAEAIYVAVSTDTGCFSYGNTTANSLRTAAACASRGFDLDAINRELFRVKTRARIGIEGYILSGIRFAAEGRCAVVSIPLAALEVFGATEDDLENISSLPAGIDGVVAAATIRETEGGGVKVSLRSSASFDSDKFCQKYGGGGHASAAGFTLRKSVSDTAEELTAALEEAVGNSC